ncbi:PTS sugar transporter subunit IIC [Neobacillus notoginsengisoli]|uniref:Permease IIC component n=1 Tax=Neobacillus notoginsengisoli TaxID=1578198 RepID=A0A417YIP9_9BACI|nr:PTS transporter subunit EIIC [Neobacillus notoginsengisoli]RHW32817.1 PTS sugar transporter subunit IIC [Neobacillus notoginsengisoli]
METKKQSKLTTFMEEKFVPVAAQIGGQRHLLALRDGIVMIMPLLILGAFAMIVIDFPIPAWIALMESAGWSWGGKIDILINATFGIMAIIAAFGVASSLAGSYKKNDGTSIDGIPAGILAIASFFVVTQSDGTGSENLFVAMAFAILTAEIYRLFVQKNWIIKLPDTVPTAVSRQFSALLPGLAILGISWLIIAVPMSYTGYKTISHWLNEGLFSWLTNFGLSYPFMMFGSFIEHLLWTFGLHGSAIIIFPFFEPLWISVTHVGTTSIITWPFYENNVWLGGSGATLPVVIYMLLFAKSKLLKDVGKISIGPGIFNINEPVTFGLPIVLNPMLMIPFILSPLVIVTIMYAGTSIGLFPIMDKIVPWTTPIFISGFLAASGDIGSRLMAVLAQVICFSASFIIYLPFIRAWDKINLKREAGEA